MENTQYMINLSPWLAAASLRDWEPARHPGAKADGVDGVRCILTEQREKSSRTTRSQASVLASLLSFCTSLAFSNKEI